MVISLSDSKHLNIMADLQQKEVKEIPIEIEQSEPSFDEDVVKLCDKLNASGFHSYAASLEKKFLNYKSAGVHLYRAIDEDGEDVINFAHPDGDAHMADASDQNGDVETILSKHKKIVDVINKQPTGKLAYYISACKIALGQELPAKIKQNFSSKIKELVVEGIHYAEAAVIMMDEFNTNQRHDTGSSIAWKSHIKDAMEEIEDAKKLVSNDMNYDNVMDVTKIIDGLFYTMAGGKWHSGGAFNINSDAGNDIVKNIKSSLFAAKTRCNAAFQLLEGQVEGAKYQLSLTPGLPSKISLDPQQSQNQTAKIDKNSIFSSIKDYKSKLSKKELNGKDQLLAWLDNVEKFVLSNKDDSKLEKTKKDLETFNTKYVLS